MIDMFHESIWMDKELPMETPNIFHEDGIYFEYPLSYVDVKFMEFIYDTEADWLCLNDVRFDNCWRDFVQYSFAEYIQMLYHERKFRCAERKTLVGRLNYLFDNCDGTHYLPYTHDIVAMKVVTRIKRRARLDALEDVILPELGLYVNSFLEVERYHAVSSTVPGDRAHLWSHDIDLAHDDGLFARHVTSWVPSIIPKEMKMAMIAEMDRDPDYHDRVTFLLEL
jgi:hypothetical protein